MGKKKTQQEKSHDNMRLASGKFTSRNKLIVFLYLLGRDRLPLGLIEGIMEQVEGMSSEEVVYTNGWLAQWAEYTADRLGEND